MSHPADVRLIDVRHHADPHVSIVQVRGENVKESAGKVMARRNREIAAW
jgi:hypothetical protein